MGSERRWALGLALRVGALLAIVAALRLALATQGLIAVRIVVAALALTAAGALWHHVRRTDPDLARFVEALGHGDFSQGFGGGHAPALARALDAAMSKLRAERARAGDEARLQ